MGHRWAVNAFFFFNGFVFASWAARLPYLQELHVLDHKRLSFILLSHSIGAFIAMPLTGWMIGKYSSKSVTTWSGVVFPFCFMAIPFMPSYLLLFLPFFMMGMSTGIMDVSMNAQAVDIEKLLKKPIMASFHGAFSIGMMIGGLAAGIFMSQGASLTLHFWSTGVITFVVMIVSSRYLYKDTPHHEDGDVLFAIPKGALVGIGIITFCCMMGEGAISDWSTNYMRRIVKSDVEIQTLGLTAFAAMMAVGRLLGDKGRSLFGDIKMLTVGAFIACIGIGLVLLLWHPLLVVIGFGMVGLGLANIIPIAFSIAGDMPGVKPGVGIAMTSTIGYTGFMFGPPIIGFVADISDLRVGLGVILLLFLIMTALVISYGRKEAKS